MTLSVQLLQIPASETVVKREFFIDADAITIGCDFACDICLPDASETMLPTHLSVHRVEGGYTVTGNSDKGTLLNGHDLISGDIQRLKDGDVISCAGYKLMFGLVAPQSKDIDPAPISHKFELQTDISGDDLLLPDQEEDEALADLKTGFTGNDFDLEQDLMFDPFAEGPEMREEAAAPQNPPYSARNETVQVMAMDAAEADSSLHNAPIATGLPREKVSGAMEKAIDRFLDELDPAVLKADYDEFIPRLVSREKRYWRIHARQFARKKANGEFRRSFMALFAEEMRKL